MRAPPARVRLGSVGVALVVAGAALLWYALGAIGLSLELPRFAPPVSRGEQIYQASCSGCHGGPTGGGNGDYPPKHNANGHTWQHADCELVAATLSGQAPAGVRGATLPPNALPMPPFRERLSESEIGEALAFIKTMWTDDQRAHQAQLTRERCGVSG
jgi:mono/diheme cytochrome c family protein